MTYLFIDMGFVKKFNRKVTRYIELYAPIEFLISIYVNESHMHLRWFLFS